MNRHSRLLAFVLIVLLVFSVSSVSAQDKSSPLKSSFYYPPGNNPPGPPPNYNLVDSTYFYGVPELPEPLTNNAGGYYIYYDTAAGKWALNNFIYSRGNSLEQFHGSILAQMESPPEPGVNIWTKGFELNESLKQNDRWGWIKWPDSIAPDLYEIWWDYTIDYAKPKDTGDFRDTFNIVLAGCAIDFNLWSSAHGEPFTPDLIYLGRDAVPLSWVPDFEDTYEGVYDQYQTNDAEEDPNISRFTSIDLPGTSYNVNGEILPGTVYGDWFNGSYAYEGNGIQFSTRICPENTPPVFVPPNEDKTDSLSICLGSTFYDTLLVTDPNPGDIITVTKISGPGTLTAPPGPSPVLAYFEWTPTEVGRFTLVFSMEDSYGAVTVDSMIYIVTFNQPPQLFVSDTTIVDCWSDGFCLPLQASDPENDPLTFALISGTGSLDPVTGELCVPNAKGGTGDFDYTVSVADSCTEVTASFTITIAANTDPHLNGYDTLIYLCIPEEICFPVTAFDPDIGDSLTISHVDGPGTFTPTGNGTGTHCFMPDNVDSARYVFRYSVLDNCWRDGAPGKAITPSPPTDSIVVTVVINQPPVISCPGDVHETLCEPTTLCYSVGGEDPDDEPLVFSLLEGPGTIDPQTGELCVDIDTEGSWMFKVAVTDTCGFADTCSFELSADMNQPPVVCVESRTKTLCGPEEICLAVNASDPDGDDLVITTSAGEYNTETGYVCLTPQETGEYEITVTATDPCGAAASAVGVVNVTIVPEPVVVGPPDKSLFICEAGGEICVGPWTDGQGSPITLSSTNFGTISGNSICFYPDTAGVYEIIGCLANECGAESCDTAYVTIAINSPPLVSARDTTVFQCALEQICLPLELSDPDDNIVAVQPSLGEYDEFTGEVCFVPTAPGANPIDITVTDDCGATASVSVTVQVDLNSPPVISGPADDERFLCAPEEICIDGYVISDPDDNLSLVSVISPVGEYRDGAVCFTPDTVGTYCLVVKAKDECNAFAKDTLCITVDFGDQITLECPSGVQTIGLCEPGDICATIPIEPAGVTVTVDPPTATYADGKLCFFADQSGQYSFTLTATTDCDTKSCTVTFDVSIGEAAQITCPSTIEKHLCGPGTITIPLGVTPSDAEVTVSPFGTYADGMLTFDADTEGTYTFDITATMPCGTDQCSFDVIVTFDSPPEMVLNDTTVFLCEPGEVCVDLAVTDPDDNISSIQSTLGQYFPGKQAVCFDVNESGDYSITVTVTDDCGNWVSKTAVAAVTVNSKPSVSVPDTTAFLCELSEICLPVDTSDVDGNIVSVETTPSGLFNPATGEICYMPSAEGSTRIIVKVTDDCGAYSKDTADIVINLNSPPIVQDKDTTVSLCEPTQICVGLPIFDADENIQSVVVSAGTYDPVENVVCLDIDGTGVYEITVTVSDDCESVSGLLTVTADVNAPPQVVVPNDTLMFLCEPEAMVQVSGFEIIDDNIQSVIITPETGTLVDGTLNFQPQPGENCFQIVAIDECEIADTANWCATVTFNSDPFVSLPDTTVFSCDFQEICLPVDSGDADGNVVSLTFGDGVYNPATGMLCYTPAAEGNYEITVTIVDECGVSVTDKSMITVIRNDPPTLTGPTEKTEFLCDIGEICVDGYVADDQNGNLDSVWVDAGVGEYRDGMLCFTPDGPGVYEFTLKAVDECSEQASLMVTVTVEANSPPAISFGPDVDTLLCTLEELCFPVDTSDADGNVVSLTFNNGTFNSLTGQLCFQPPNSGTYILEGRIADECGREDVDSLVLTVEVNNGPSVTISDQQFFQCALGEVCIPVDSSGGGSPVTSLTFSMGTYNPITGQLCFSPDAPGDYTIEASIADECGQSATSTAVVSIQLNSPPTVIAPADFPVAQCTPSEICAEGFTVDDPDGNIQTIEVISGQGDYVDGTICFMPDTSGTYCLIVKATDDCGEVAKDTMCIEYSRGVEVVIDCPGTQDVGLCQPDQVCIAIPVTPLDAQITVLEPGATYENGMLCFFAETTGTYTFTIQATTDCDTKSCQITFNVTIGESAQLTCPGDGTEHLCGPGPVSVPIGVMPPSATLSISPPADFADGVLTFQADSPGDYCFEIIADMPCGADTCNFCVDVSFDSPPQVTLRDTTVFQCAFDEICIPVETSDPDNNIVSIVPSLGSYLAGNICFTPTAAGEYPIDVTVTDDCGLSVDGQIVVTVVENQPPTIAVNDTTVFICEPEDVCLTTVFSDPEEEIASITVSSPGYFNDQTGKVCVPADQTGTINLTVTIEDACGATAQDQAVVSVQRNSAPEITDISPSQISACDLSEICFDIAMDDADDNVFSIVGIFTDPDIPYADTVTFDDGSGTFCWTPPAFATYSLQLIATDICGMADTLLTEIVVDRADDVQLVCPSDTTIFLCYPGEVCIEIPGLAGVQGVSIIPDNFQFNSETGEICYTAETNRSDLIEINLETTCGSQSCSFTAHVLIDHPPVIAGPETYEDLICGSTSLCLDMNISDADNNIDTVFVEGDCEGATWHSASSQVCVNVVGSLQCELKTIVVDSCGLSDTLVTAIDVSANQPPEIIPPTIQSIARCQSDEGSVFIYDICITDPDFEPVTLALDSGNGQFTFDPEEECGYLEFTPDAVTEAKDYCFKFHGSDQCNDVYETICITVEPASVCSTCVFVEVETPECAPSGSFVNIDVLATTESEIGGYDLLLAYDASALNFMQAELGSAIGGWEYFTYRFGPSGNCSGSCPSGMVRLFAIADINNGANHPPKDQLSADGSIATMTFRVTPNLLFGGQNIPIRFFWFDCGDNTFSDPSGEYLLVDQVVIDYDGSVIWDEFDDENYPDEERDQYSGAPDECIKGDKDVPIRCSIMKNGALCIIHPDSIDARGDLNLNGVQYDVADAVVYTNFFVYGLDAFTINKSAQIAASDVNADGVTLSVSDLVYLIRIITGEASPIPRPTVEGVQAGVNCSVIGDAAEVSVKSASDIGAALFVFHYDGARPSDPELAGGAEGMDIKYEWYDSELRVLVYSMEAGHKIAAGQRSVLSFEVPEFSTLTLAEASLATYFAREIESSISNDIVPREFALSQNYPNPFNPATTFRLAVPQAGDYRVTIYNVLGQTVREWKGSSEPGIVTIFWDGTNSGGDRVASGVYLYKAKVGGKEASRKMVLLK